MRANTDGKGAPVMRFSPRALWHGFRAAPRARIMIYALVTALLCGVTGFLEPLDDFGRSLRYAARVEKADGSIVVVGIDQKTADQLGGKWPWPHTIEAEFIDKLKRAGVRKIMYDRTFTQTDTAANDRKLIEVLDRYRGDIYFGAAALTVSRGKLQTLQVPAEKFRPHVEIVSLLHRTNPIGQVGQLYTKSPVGPPFYPAMSTVLAERPLDGTRLYRPDFAIRADSFKTLSYLDVLSAADGGLDLRGKDVVVGVTDPMFGDAQYLPGQGRVQGVYNHVIGAQTLKRGVPVDAGWFPALLASALASGLLLRMRRMTNALAIATLFTGGSIVAAFALDERNISVDFAPAALMFLVVTVQYARLMFGWRKSRTHEPSGLPNAVALRELRLKRPCALVAARIDNHAAITASFAADVEALLASEIVARLKVGDAGVDVYQGDEGVYFMLSPISDRALLSEHLDGLSALFAQPVRIGDRQVDVAMTFGVDDEPQRAMASRMGGALLSAEDAKLHGLRWKFYDDARNVDAAWMLSLGGEIDRGLAAGEFWVAYQPKADLRTASIVGAEALLRWDHPLRGPISPAEFIPAAERDHRIERLTEFVTARVIEDMVAQSTDRPLSVAINVSVPVLRNSSFAEEMLGKVMNAGLSPSCFTIEITESIFLSIDDRTVMANLEQFVQHGFEVSIDDFGTGFSTLETLQRVPSTEVKIDQTFVKAMSRRGTDAIIVSSMIRMAKRLNRKVVAEGIEDGETLRTLAAMGCDYGQGFFIGRPWRLGELGQRVVAASKVRAA